jgi:hypothetical protein
MAVSKGVNYSTLNKQMKSVCVKQRLLLSGMVSFLPATRGNIYKARPEFRLQTGVFLKMEPWEFIFHSNNIKTSS